MDFGAQLKEQLEKLSNQKADYERLVSDRIKLVEQSTLSRKEKDKRILELCHLASFAIGLKDAKVIQDVKEIEIVDLSVEPDFIIIYKNEKIGLEIRRVFNDKVQQTNERRTILKFAAKIFENKYPGHKVLASIRFTDSFDERANNTDEIKNRIADFVYAHRTRQSFETLEFIESIHCTDHSQVSFGLTGAYWVGNLDSEIKEGIEEKNKKVSNYKVKGNLTKTWLLLVVSGASPDSDFTDFDPTTFEVENSFDSVFLLNDMKKQVYFLTKDWDNRTTN
jgi:hypothetical protein